MIVRCVKNSTVTSHNFDVITDACKRLHVPVIDTTCFREALKKGMIQDVYVATTISDVIKLHFCGRRKIFFWIQGILPEESLMRHGKGLRFAILSYAEKKAIQYAMHVACVSQAMREHYEKKYSIDLSSKYSVFPCYNTSLVSDAFKKRDKYKNNVFVYAGGLAVWQCFDKTLAIYKKIEDLGISGTKLLVLTKNQEQAKKLIEAQGIVNYETGFYPKEELPKVLADAKFGFVIREDHPVNAVATPTKISTYLSCGLIPIFSSCIRSFKQQSEGMKYVAKMENPSDIEMITKFMTIPLSNEEVLIEYQNLYERYYSDEKYIREIGGIISNML